MEHHGLLDHLNEWHLLALQYKWDMSTAVSFPLRQKLQMKPWWSTFANIHVECCLLTLWTANIFTQWKFNANYDYLHS